MSIGFTRRGLARLGLPRGALASFPPEFLQGMRARADLLGDTGSSAPQRWDPAWRDGRVDCWLGVHALTEAALEERCRTLELMAEQNGVKLLYAQDARVLPAASGQGRVEHFGFADGFANPSFEGDERGDLPGQGKLTPDGGWVPLATGEFLLGYPDESRELPAAPRPHLLARNGTFMVYRKLRQDVARFREYLSAKGREFPGGEEKLAAKLVGRWRDGTPLELSPDRPNPEVARRPFTYGSDPEGGRCPLGAHIRRANPRDAAGFDGRLVNNHRIFRRGIPYSPHAPEGQPVDDQQRGIIFMALNASLARQFEFVQQQWIQYGNDARQGNDRDPIVGDNSGRGRFVIQGGAGPPFICGHLPTFVELRGGDYFFMPSITALRMIAAGAVDER